MKLTNTQTMKRKSGMTLLELTVVILVLLSLISILFIGARAWKKGSDRAANILNIRNVQQAVRAHANVRGLLEGAALASTEIVGTGKYLEQRDRSEHGHHLRLRHRRASHRHAVSDSPPTASGTCNRLCSDRRFLLPTGESIVISR